MIATAVERGLISSSAPDGSVELPQRSDKISPRHTERLGVVYVRQSSMTQVRRNQESTKLQYNLVHLAQRLGWSPERILVIDDDLGVSGRSAEGRLGFQKLLAEVALDHVGIILGVEMSRLARSNKDWHQLLELCARFGTLIADLDGLYDPSLYNDRLLLGLKGTMSEAELHILRQRLLQGKLQKARRGELAMPVPTGYLRTLSDEVSLDPDEEVQAVVRLIFELFGHLGTIHGVLKELVRRDIQIGVRLRTGPDIGALVWRRPHRGIVSSLLRNPIYSGAYVYGRRRTDPRRQKPGRPASGRTGQLPNEQWQVCLRDRLPAYITWDQYESNQERLMRNRANNTGGRGPVRNGSALLQGLLVCGRCDHRLTVQYGSRQERKHPRYVCGYGAVHYGSEVCSGMPASRLDEVVTDLALAALEPGALDVSIRVAEDLEREREKAQALWAKRLERAHYEAERARRQYHAVEPENRLVARTLERNWEEKLRVERELQEEARRERSQEPRHLTADERTMIRELADDLPQLWNAATTSPEDRKNVLRLLIDRVVVTIEQDSEWVDAVVHWAGGHETPRRFRRPVANLTQLSDYKELIGRIQELRSAGYTAARIADKLNAEGWVTAMHKNRFNDRLVRMILHRHGYVPRGPLAPPTDDPDEWRLSDLAKELGMPLPTLYGWLQRGRIEARRVAGKWVARADSKELERLRRMREETPNQRG